MALLFGWATGSASPIAAAGLAFLAFVSIAIQSFKKPFYCYHLCPYGAAQELIGIVPVRKRTLPFLFKGSLSKARWVILVGAAAAVFSVPGIDLSQIEPFTAFTPRAATPWVIGVAAFFLVVSIFVPRAWCRVFCPTGAFLSIFSRRKSKQN